MSFGRLVYVAAIFVSSLLLFLIQPVVAKAILPRFGGSAGVWTTCMLFFQVMLLGGYFYAHLLARYVPLRAQFAIHVGLLCASLLLLPVSPYPSARIDVSGDPAIRILILLSISIGLPYFLLSANSPLLQSWFSRTRSGAIPYRLFAVSNIGSLLALLLYPVLVEPALAIRAQLAAWSWAYGGYVAMAAAVAVLGLRAGASTISVEMVHAAIPAATQWTWVALAASASTLWLAVANHLSQDVAAIPFLWILPLSLYLLSFILCFDRPGWYQQRIFRFLLPAAWLGLAAGFALQGTGDVLKWSVVLFSAALFVCCMFCHGELARLKPPPESLTTFYLMIALGGALGAVFVGFVAPRVFNEFLELPLGLIATVLLAVMLLYNFRGKRTGRLAITALVAIIAALQTNPWSDQKRIQIRNFYGTLRVIDSGSTETAMRSLYNGTIRHGLQWMSPTRSRLPTTYFGAESGVGLALRNWLGRTKRFGVIGLGVGTLAAYGQAGDTIRFYEINPLVIRLANTEFRYLRECPAKIEVVTGDGRLSLEAEPPQGFDVLAMDAFSGDSVPIHLLTREAFELYFRHLAPDGVLAVHVTNKYLNLVPVVKALAENSKRSMTVIENFSDYDRRINYSMWALVTNNHDLLVKLKPPRPVQTARALPRLWTDDYSNLFQVLK